MAKRTNRMTAIIPLIILSFMMVIIVCLFVSDFKAIFMDVEQVTGTFTDNFVKEKRDDDGDYYLAIYSKYSYEFNGKTYTGETETYSNKVKGATVNLCVDADNPENSWAGYPEDFKNTKIFSCVMYVVVMIAIFLFGYIFSSPLRKKNVKKGDVK